MRRVVIAAAVVLAVAGAATAAPVAFFDQGLNAGWNIGNGQFNNHFVGVRDGQFAGGSIELGLRTQQRGQGAYTPTLVNSIWGTMPMYVTTPGTDPNNAARAVWNFDGSVAFSGGVGTLDDVSVRIDAVSGTVQELGDLSVPGSLFFPTSNQFSQNPVFSPWSTGPYDFNATGLYLVTLSVREGNETISTQMLVNVGNVEVPTPEPVSLVVFGSLIVGATVAVWRRQAKRA